MVSPWMDNGNLTTYLRHNESANRQEIVGLRSLTVSFISLIQFKVSALRNSRCMVFIGGFATYIVANRR